MMAMTLREPLGVVSLITPWNFPVNIPGWKLASALVCGNTVVLKPAGLTPCCAVALVEILAEAGVPDGVVNLVLGSGSEVGDVLVTDPRVKAISFTGSTAVGLGINAKAAPLGKKVQAEMGGHNAVVVLADADLDRAAQGCAAAAYGTTGQRCTAPRRVIAVREVAAELTERLAAATRAVRVGPGDSPDSDIGPLVDEHALDEVIGQIEQARNEGAVVLEGGGRAGNGNGYFLEPTLLAKVEPEMTIASEEVFGPVLPVLEVEDFDQALRARRLDAVRPLVLRLHERPAERDPLHPGDRHRGRPRQQASDRGRGAPAVRRVQGFRSRRQGARRCGRLLHPDQDRVPRPLIGGKPMEPAPYGVIPAIPTPFTAGRRGRRRRRAEAGGPPRRRRRRPRNHDHRRHGRVPAPLPRGTPPRPRDRRRRGGRGGDDLRRHVGLRHVGGAGAVARRGRGRARTRRS